jgi:hypothetical protein
LNLLFMVVSPECGRAETMPRQKIADHWDQRPLPFAGEGGPERSERAG